jgi:uncharacterized protein (TIRG00374 family)
MNLGILFVLRSFYWLLKTLYWKVILDSLGEKVPLGNLFAARMASHAIGYLTPAAQLGGEAVRALMADCQDRKKCVASIILDKTLEILTVLVFTVVGVILTVVLFPVPGKVKIVFLGCVLVGFLFILFIIAKQRRGLISWLIGLIQKIRIRPRILDRHREKIEEVDEHMADFLRSRPKALALAIGLSALITLYWAGEIHLTLIFAGEGKASFLVSFLVTMLGTLAFLIPAIPGSLGTYELTFLGTFSLFGLGSALAMTVTIVRRILALVWAGFGLVFMALKKTEK